MIPRTYDDLYKAALAEAGSAIPLSFLRALSWRESALNSGAKNAGSTATGLFQITRAVVLDRDAALGIKPPTPQIDLKDPGLNVKIAIWHLDRIAKLFAKDHPRLRQEWQSSDFAGVMALAYHAGQGGVGMAMILAEKVVREPSELTFDDVLRAGKDGHAKAVTDKDDHREKALRYVADPESQTYAERVLTSYFSDPPAPALTHEQEDVS